MVVETAGAAGATGVALLVAPRSAAQLLSDQVVLFADAAAAGLLFAVSHLLAAV